MILLQMKQVGFTPTGMFHLLKDGVILVNIHNYLFQLLN